jgi:hypothetical protein
MYTNDEFNANNECFYCQYRIIGIPLAIFITENSHHDP